MCNRILTCQICKSNKNRNCGRTFVSCFCQHSSPISTGFLTYLLPLWMRPLSLHPAQHPHHHHCHQITAHPQVHLPFIFQPVLPSVPCHNSLPPSTFTIRLPAHSAITSLSQLPASMLCTQSGCKVTRVHPDCARKKCRHHCVADGGCMVKTHTQWEAQVLSGSPEPPILDAKPAQDLFADPCHASQMMAVFTQHYAHEQTIQEEWHMVDAERMSNDV